MCKVQALCLAMIAGILAPAWTQVISGVILGTVVDASGAVVSGAQVTLTNEQTNLTFKAPTDTSGNYVVPNLPPGNYSVKVEANGFKPSLAKRFPTAR